MDELAKALADDLDGAFPALVTAMGPRLFWGLRRMCGDHQEAEDLTQEALIRAYRALTGYDRARIVDLNLTPWMWTIALNLGRNHHRSRSRRPTLVEMTDIGADPDDPVDSAAWDRRFGHLTSPQRRAVVLRHIVGMGISEISSVTGRPQGTVKADIHRGLEKLREAMEAEA